MRRLFSFTAGVILLFTTIPAVANTAQVDCDVVVYGDSLGGVGAAVASARNGADTCLLATVGYAGGQATAAGVSTMDEGSLILRQSGLYQELVEELVERYGARELQTAYFASFTDANLIGPDPLSVKQILDEWLVDSNVRVYSQVLALDVLHDGLGRPVAIIGNDGNNYHGLIVDASETQELFPMIQSLQYTTGDGSCMQDLTWTVVLQWYEDGVPDDLWVPVNLDYQLAAVYGWPEVESWQKDFEALLNVDGMGASSEVWTDLSNKVALRFTDGYTGYRGTYDLNRPNGPGTPIVTRTGLNWANDSDFASGALSDQRLLSDTYARAQAKTYLLMWYVRHKLGEDHWAIANNLGYESVARPSNNPLISDRVERHFPLIPYIREGRRFTHGMDHMFWAHLANEKRGQDQWSNSVLLGAYFTDTHDCVLLAEQASQDGLYDVPLGIFVPRLVDNFLVALPRAGDVDRAVASSLRMQPPELNGGQAVGVLASIAKKSGVEPRDVPAGDVRDYLIGSGALVDVP